LGIGPKTKEKGSLAMSSNWKKKGKKISVEGESAEYVGHY